MLFKIKAGTITDNKVMISGFLKPVTETEKKLLTVMIEEFKNIKTYDEKFYTNGQYIIFKSVEMGELKKALELMGNNLSFKVTYTVDKEKYMGDKKILKLFNINV